MMKMMTTAQLATELDTTPRTVRKFLRSQGQGVGKGSRYALPSNKREVAKMRRAFEAWSAPEDPAPEVESTDED
jgi:predicted transcriptional regulator